MVQKSTKKRKTHMKQRKRFSLSRPKEHNSTASTAVSVRAPQAVRTRCNLSAYALKYQRVRAKIPARTHSDDNAYALRSQTVRAGSLVRARYKISAYDNAYAYM